MKDLRIITGGLTPDWPGKPKTKTGGGGGKDGGVGGGTSGRRRKPFKPHPDAELFWSAVCKNFYDKRAASAEEIASRMTSLSRKISGKFKKFESVEVEAINHCIKMKRFD